MKSNSVLEPFFEKLNLYKIVKIKTQSSKTALKTLLLLLFFLANKNVKGQTYIRATVLDESANPLPFAAVSLLQLPDSNIVVQGQTNESGDVRFSTNKRDDHFLLQITYIGYEFFNKNIEVVDNQRDTIDLGAIKLTPLSKILSEATVVAKREAVQIRGDTMAFDAKSYQVQPNAVAGDLIKKLPGVEMEKDGTVKAQGEDVQQILINGKPFFGNDVQIALQNLPADAIEGVEIYDKKSDQSAFSGIDDGVRKKTINIKLKQNLKKVKNGKIKTLPFWVQPITLIVQVLHKKIFRLLRDKISAVAAMRHLKRMSQKVFKQPKAAA